MTDNETPERGPTFEASLETLERLVNELETGDLSLDDLIGRYEEGMQLIAACRKRLAEAELRVTEIAAETEDESPAPF